MARRRLPRRLPHGNPAQAGPWLHLSSVKRWQCQDAPPSDGLLNWLLTKPPASIRIAKGCGRDCGKKVPQQGLVKIQEPLGEWEEKSS
ncbi:MAG: hypothetical protein ABSH14_15725 [Verrucomicrobiia bacterium]